MLLSALEGGLLDKVGQRDRHATLWCGWDVGEGSAELNFAPRKSGGRCAGGGGAGGGGNGRR